MATSLNTKDYLKDRRETSYAFSDGIIEKRIWTDF